MYSYKCVLKSKTKMNDQLKETKTNTWQNKAI